MTSNFYIIFLLILIIIISGAFIWFYMSVYLGIVKENQNLIKHIAEAESKIDIRIKERTKHLEDIRDSVSGYAVQKFELAQELELKNLELTEQKDYNAKQSEKLRIANDEIRMLDSFRKQMVNMLIHDLKNPLNVILNLTDSADIPSKPKSIIRQISFEMLDLILNILDVNKFEELKMKIECENINMYSLIKSLIDKHSSLFVNASMNLEINVPQDLWIYADRHIVNRILGNLLSNSLKYTPSGGEIQIFASEEGEFVNIEVKDNGSGIPKDNVENLFQMYSQGERAKTLYNNSTGIGLAYCKLAVEALGGSIGILTDTGEGTMVWFKLIKGIASGENTLEHQGSGIGYSLPDISLTNKDIELIKPYLTELQSISICEVTKILELTAQIDSSGNEQLSNWKEMVEETLFSANEKRFRELTNI